MNQRHDRTNRNSQRVRCWAISMLGNAKSNRHRKTTSVEAGGTGRPFMHLTRGDLRHESVAEVSRRRSSEEGRESGWSEGQKENETN